MRAAQATGRGLRKHAYALAIGLLWGAVTVKFFWFTSEPFVEALGASYGMLTTVSLGFIAAVLGLQGLFDRLGQ